MKCHAAVWGINVYMYVDTGDLHLFMFMYCICWYVYVGICASKPIKTILQDSEYFHTVYFFIQFVE